MTSHFGTLLFLNIEGETTSENQRIMFKSLSMPYFITKQLEVEQNNKYCLDSEKSNLQEDLQLKYTKIRSLDEVWGLR